MNVSSLKSSRRSLCPRHLAASKFSARRRGALALSLGLAVAGFVPFASANTADNVNNGQTDLTLPGTYTGGAPTTASDVTFTAVAYSPATFTLNTNGYNLSIGTLDDLSTTALAIQNTTSGNTSTITLNGGTNATGGSSNAADLLYVATGGSLTIGGGAGTLNLALGTAGNFNIAGTAAISAVISDSGTGFTKTGSGTLTLSGANTYTGNTTNAAGTIQLGSASALGTGTYTISSSANTANTTDLNGQTLSNALLSGGNGAVITNSSATAATISTGFNTAGAANFVVSDFTVNGTGNINWSGAIHRTLYTGNITKSGTNTLTLSGVGTGYTNFTYTVSGGTLAFSMPTGSTFNSGAIIDTASVVGAETTGVTNTISQVISGTGGTFTQSGAGTTIFTTNNTYTGATTISAGTLQLGTGGTAGAVSSSSAITDNGVLVFNQSNNLTQGTDFAAGVSGSGSITKMGSGTLVLSGTNTYMGGTTNASAGTLQLGSSTALGSGNYTPSTGTTGTITDLNGQTLSNPLTNGGNGAVFTNTSSSVATVSSGYNQAGASNFTVSDFTVQGTGNINWSGAIDRNSYHGTVTVAGPNTLTLTGAGTGYQGEAYTVSGGTLAVNMPTGSSFGGYGITDNANVSGAESSGVTNTISQAISGTGTFTQSGAGTTVLSAVNTFSGGATVNAGTLNLTAANTYTGGTTVNAGTLNLSEGGGSGAIEGTLTINSGGTVNTTVTDALGYGSGTSVTQINVNAGGVFNNSVSGNEGYLASFTLTGGSVTSTGGGGINFNGTGIASVASPTTALFIAPVVLRNAMTITTATGTTASGVDLSVSGAISQNGGTYGFTKAGLGTLSLSGANTYAGVTAVSAGTLLVGNNSGATGAVNVASGATLGGSGTASTTAVNNTGTIAGTTTVNGTITGAAVGTIGMLTLTSTSATTISASGIYLVDINSMVSDNLKLSGALTITSGASLTFAGTPGAASYDLANYTSETGTFAVTNLPGGYTLNYGATELDLVSSVPEPSTWIAGLLSLGMLGHQVRGKWSGRIKGVQAA